MSIKEKLNSAKPTQFFDDDVVDGWIKCRNQIYNQALEDVMKIYNEMQPQLATRVYEFGERIERLKK